MRFESGPIVVSGLGIVTSLGSQRSDTWSALVSGQTGIRREGTALTARVSEQMLESRRLTQSYRISNRTFELLVTAALAAWTDGACAGRFDPRRVGVIVGMGALDQIGSDWQRSHSRPLTETVSAMHPLRRLNHLPNVGAALVAIATGAQGAVITLTNGTNAGLQAIQLAMLQLASGALDAVLCGAADVPMNRSMSGLPGSRYHISKATEVRDGCRPFDRNHNGTILGEGGAVLVLERRGGCSSLPRRPYAECVLAVSSANGVNDVLRSVGKAATYDAIFTHGDGVPYSDRMEVDALRAWIDEGKPARAPAMTSVKAALGHTGAASGAVSGAVAALSIASGIIPPIWNLGEAIAPLAFVRGSHGVESPHESVLVLTMDPLGSAAAMKLRRVSE